MATPASHATAANDLLNAAVAPRDHVSPKRNAERAAVHAILSNAAGTGTHYTAAETALAEAVAKPYYFHVAIVHAHAHALLAD